MSEQPEQPRARARRAPVRALTVEQQKARYLKAVELLGTLRAGCRAGRVSPHTVYQWREHDEDFMLRERETREAFIDSLEEIAVKRARDGSDKLVAMLLGALRPEKYKRRVDLTTTLTEPAIKSYADVDLDAV